MIKRVTVAAFGLGAFLLSSAVSAAPPYGVWASQKGDVRVRLTDCGGKLCGKLVWLEQSVDPTTGKPKTDKLNPDPAKRSRPLIGIKVVNGFRPSGPHKWSGTIYNADNGHSYRANLVVLSPRTARLEGCMLVLLCMGHTWRRVDGEAGVATEAQGDIGAPDSHRTAWQ